MYDDKVTVIWKSDEYIRRAQAHGASLGAATNLKRVRERLSWRKDVPLWLKEELADIQKQINLLPPELAAHRDEVQP